MGGISRGGPGSRLATGEYRIIVPPVTRLVADIGVKAALDATITVSRQGAYLPFLSELRTPGEPREPRHEGENGGKP